MKIKDRAPLFCVYCGGKHPSADCEPEEVTKVPLETPSHNGPYQGTIPVRTIPYGVSGIAFGQDRGSVSQATKERAQRKMAARRADKALRMCKWCEVKPCSVDVEGYFCSKECRAKRERKRQREKDKIGPRQAPTVPFAGSRAVRLTVLETNTGT